jgi:Coenzyme PQQ synthesis protein D (PqqD)
MLGRINDNSMLFQRGIVGNDDDGTPLLINEKGEGYRVNDTAISLWNMCNGITFQEFVYEVLRISNDDESNVKQSLLKMLRQLKKASVIEIKKLKENPVVSF